MSQNRPMSSLKSQDKLDRLTGDRATSITIIRLCQNVRNHHVRRKITQNARHDNNDTWLRIDTKHGFWIFFQQKPDQRSQNNTAKNHEKHLAEI